MNKDEYLYLIHAEILDIMDIIDDICQKNNIKYYLTGGTLLGAVRHGGFIPWDDDFDIVMPRNDFNRFIDICSSQLPKGYSLQWITTRKDYWRVFAKVCNDNTKFIELIGKSEKTDNGIFVDIFPIDDSAGYDHKLQRRKNIIEKIKVLINAKKAPSILNGAKKIIPLIIPNKILFKIVMFLMTKNNRKGYVYYSNFGSQYKIQNKTIEKEKLGVGVKIQFEDRMYTAPSFYKEVLNNTFGDKYMDIPPEFKRKTHYPIYVRFSNGEEIIFEQHEKRLKVDDTY